METTRKPRVPMSEQIKLINECRRSGMTDADWCREHDIAPSTFYNWISRCRKAACGQIIEPNYGHQDSARTRQDVVPVSIVPEHIPARSMTQNLPAADPYLDNSHTIEVVMDDLMIRIHNDVDPILLTRTLRILRGTLC